MKRALTSVLMLAASLVTAVATAREITLPADTSTLRVSELPGYAIARHKCGICHSADYISYQAPAMNQAQWTAEMLKMQHSYGAPIDEDETRLIGAYLAVSYGSADKDDASVVALSALAQKAEPAPGEAGEIDVQALLVSNTCLACHAIENKVVGPSFREVAARYRSEAHASSRLAESIRAGGTGKWGAGCNAADECLTAAQAQALAQFVLAQ
ncbi:MAG: cytochrome C552 [Gammaproteobacteria bacterium]|nr:cytochrome C552 [Gammaproteobacteria bacterium]